MQEIHLTDIADPERKATVSHLQKLSDSPLSVFAWNIENSLRWRAVDTLVRSACAILQTDIYLLHPDGRLVARLTTTGDWVAPQVRVYTGLQEEQEAQPIAIQQFQLIKPFLPSSWSISGHLPQFYSVSRQVAITDHGRRVLDTISWELPSSDTLHELCYRSDTYPLTHESTKVWRDGVSINAGDQPEPGIQDGETDSFPMADELREILELIKADTGAIRAESDSKASGNECSASPKFEKDPASSQANSAILKDGDTDAGAFRDGDQWCDAKYASENGVTAQQIDRARQREGLYGIRLTERRKADARRRPWVYRRTELEELANAIEANSDRGIPG